MTSANGHPTDLELERHLLDVAASPLAPHLASCDPCRARVARMEEEGERFRRFVYPATVDRIEAAAEWRRPWRTWFSVLAPVAAAGMAVAVVIAIRSGGPPAGYLGVKGDLVGLAAYVQRDGAAAQVSDRAAVAADAALRLRVRTAEACRLFVLSIDDRGTVSRLDGGRRQGLVVEAGQHDLPGGVVLDGAAGPERLFAVCAAAGLEWPTVAQAAREVGSGGAERVRTATALGTLPAGTSQATLLLEKTP